LSSINKTEIYILLYLAGGRWG